MKEQNIDQRLKLQNLVIAYQRTNDDYYLTELWNEVKPFSIKITNKYYNASKDDKESLSLECLWKVCKTIKPNTNFLTYYGTVLNNRCYDCFVKQANTNNRKVLNEAYSLDKLKEDLNFDPGYDQENFNLNFFFEQCKLTEQESTLCALFYMGYKRVDIVNRLKLIKKNEYIGILASLRDKIAIYYLDEGKQK